MGWGVGVGEVFTHLWDKHTSQGHEELIPVHWRTANFHCNTKPASCGRGPQKIQIWDSMKGDYSIPKLGLNCKMRCICDLGCCLIPIPSLTWASCPFILQYRLSLDWIVQRLLHSKFPSREWLSRMCLSRASHVPLIAVLPLSPALSLTSFRRKFQVHFPEFRAGHTEECAALDTK